MRRDNPGRALLFPLTIIYTEPMADVSAPAYEVTATRRRPKTFDELAGQEFVVSTLKNSLKNGSIAHAYLFSGPRGCGKTSAARILARSLNCESLNGGQGSAEFSAENPCGVCDNCIAISRGVSMDVIEIDGASNRGIDDVRQIKDEVLFPPQAGRCKVYIIDEVHMLSREAFNALLKTIEEPPPYIVFIFATTEIHKVPATIKSRCQQFSFRLIPIETIQELLKNICSETGITAEDNALFWIAKESTGSLREAFTLFDQVAAFSDWHIRESLIREKLGLAGLETINSLAESCAVSDSVAAFSQIAAIIESGAAIEQFIIDLAGYYRSLLLLKNGITKESILGYKTDQFSAKVLENLDSIRLEQALEILLECYRNIRYSVSPRFELETAVSKLSWLNQWVAPAELKTALDETQRILQANAGTQQVSPLKPSASISSKDNYGKPAFPHVEEQSIADECRRILSGSNGRLSEPADREIADDDVPVWSGMLRNDKKNNGPDDNVSSGSESSAARVLRLIPGTIVN